MKYKKYIRIRKVVNLTGLSKSTLFRLMAADLFPLRRRLGPNSIGWLSDEVMLWLAARPVVA